MLSLKRALALIFLFVGVESSLSLIFPLSFDFPHLSLPVLAYAALQGGPGAGARCGLWLGFLLDMIAADRFGFYTALYGFVGLSCGWLRGKVFAEAFISQWLIPAAAYLLILFVTFSALPAREDLGGFAEFTGAVRGSPFFWTAAASPFIFLFCEKHLRSKKSGPSTPSYR